MSIFSIFLFDKILMITPYLFSLITKYNKKEKEIPRLPDNKTKTASVTVEVILKQSTDILAHSILDYITTRPNIQSILYANQNFMLNHKTPILINEQEEIYICLLNDIENATQLIEIYSYILNVEELRAFIKKVEYIDNLQVLSMYNLNIWLFGVLFIVNMLKLLSVASGTCTHESIFNQSDIANAPLFNVSSGSFFK